ncbi:unnamed protein product [Caenorhabditis nigoni]
MLPFGFLLRRILGGRRRRRNQNYSSDVTYRTVYVMPGAQPQSGRFNEPPPAYYPQDPAQQTAFYPPQKGFGRRRRCCR